MPLTIYTARLPRPEKGRRGYTGRDLLDVTRQAADAAALRGEPAPGAPFAPSVAIHAAKTREGLPPTAEHTAALPPDLCILEFPLGAVVAVADLVDVLHVERHDPVYVDPSLLAVISGTRSWHVSRADVALGDLSIGRWAWRLANVRALRTPVALRGMQGLWEIDEATERAVMAQAEASRG